MLGAFRSKKNNPVVLVLLGFVVILMAGFGVTLSGSSGGRWAARVNGEEIPYSLYAQAYTQAFRSRQMSNPNYDRARAEGENLRRLVIDELVGRKLLALEAEARGLHIGDETLRAQLLSFPAFQVNGRFDPEVYERTVRAQGSHPVAFETTLREELLGRQVLGLSTGTSPSEAEIRELWLENNTTINAKFVKITDELFESQASSLSDADIEAWRNSVDDPKSAISSNFESNKSTKYEVPKQVCARHILLKLSSATSDEEKAERKTRLETLAGRIAQGELSFEDAASTHSEDSSKSKAGDLGCFGPGQMVPKFEEAAFKLAKGGTSDVIESRFGYHLIKVYDVKEAISKTLADVSDEIEKELASEHKVHDLARAHADKILAKAKTSTSGLAQAVHEIQSPELALERTMPVTRVQFFIPKLGATEPYNDDLWTLTKENPLSKAPIALPNEGWVLFELIEIKDPEEDKYQEQTQQLKMRLMFEKQQVVRERIIESLRAQAEIEFNPVALTYNDDVRRRTFGQQ